MSALFRIRTPRPDDVTALASVHVRSWQETYRGLMPDDVLDRPDAVADRERFWTSVLADLGATGHRAALAEVDRKVVGIAMAGAPQDADARWSVQLFILYVLASRHGSGIGAALLSAVVDDDEPAALWVAEPNPRAQAFYRKRRFVADGAVQDGRLCREIRMTRR